MKYKVTINGEDNLEFYGLSLNEFEAGSKVSFRVAFLTDCNTTVTSKQTKIEMTGYDNRDNFFSFTMPQSDVEIEITSTNNMMNTMPIQPMISLTNDMYAYQNKDIEKDATVWKCPCCGYENKETAKFCYNCGTRLKEK